MQMGVRPLMCALAKAWFATTPPSRQKKSVFLTPRLNASEPRCGTEGNVDLTGIIEHGMFLAMPLNSAQYRIPNDQVGLNRLPQQHKSERFTQA